MGQSQMRASKQIHTKEIDLISDTQNYIAWRSTKELMAQLFTFFRDQKMYCLLPTRGDRNQRKCLVTTRKGGVNKSMWNNT